MIFSAGDPRVSLLTRVLRANHEGVLIPNLYRFFLSLGVLSRSSFTRAVK
jgi:hypothetical protein